MGVREVMRYSAALNHGSKRTPSVELLEELCSILKGIDVHIRHDTEQVFLKGSDGSIVFTPPSGREVKRYMDDLVEFLLKKDDMNPLIKMAVSHVQLEMIHPFMDGNGRTGRMMNLIYLQYAGLLDEPVLFLSRYLIENRRDYYRYLNRVRTRDDWESWIIFMLNAVESTSLQAMAQIRAIDSLYYDVCTKCRGSKCYSKELMDVIFSKVYCKVSFLVDVGIAERNTASHYLKELESLGILKGEKVGRETIYRNTALADLLS